MALIDGVVAYYKCDGDITDETGVNNGTNYGTSDSASGLIGNCRSFNNGGFGTGTNSSINFAGAFTISLWFKTTDATFAYLYGKDGGAGQKQIDISFYSAGTIAFLYRNASGIIVSSINYGDNNWHHIVATSDGTNTELWFDGTSKGTSTKGAESTAGQGVFGGRDGDRGDYVGLMDEMGMWDRELTDAEIAQLYNSGDGLAYPFLIGFTRKIKISGTFADKPIKTKVGGTFVDKPIKIKVGGTFQDA